MKLKAKRRTFGKDTRTTSNLVHGKHNKKTEGRNATLTSTKKMQSPRNERIVVVPKPVKEKSLAHPRRLRHDTKKKYQPTC